MREWWVMNMLSIQWSLSEISLALGILISIISLLKPLYKWIKKKADKAQQNSQTLKQLPGQLNQISEDISSIKESSQKQNDDIAEVKKTVTKLQNQINDFERQEIVREVNNTFYSFPSLQDIPDDILQDTLESCEIYISNGYNHNTKPKCELLIEEYNRRLAKEAKHE